jgi:hypothetical protein
MSPFVAYSSDTVSELPADRSAASALIGNGKKTRRSACRRPTGLAYAVSTRVPTRARRRRR